MDIKHPGNMRTPSETPENFRRHDALHRRTRKTTPAETRDCYFDRQWRSNEERVTGAVKAKHIWSPLDRWTLIRRKRSVTGTLDETLFCLKDHLDPAAIVNSSGAVQERYSYDAFGPVRFLNTSFGSPSGTSSVDWTLLFHAEFLDPESGLYNYGYRFYHPSLGRWISRDPIGEAGGWNLYGFVGNDGVNGWDILGLQVDMAPFTPQPVPGATRGERHAPGKVLDPNDPSLTPEQKKAIEEGQSNLPRTQKDNGERCGRICRNRDGSLMSTNNEFTYYAREILRKIGLLKRSMKRDGTEHEDIYKPNPDGCAPPPCPKCTTDTGIIWSTQGKDWFSDRELAYGVSRNVKHIQITPQDVRQLDVPPAGWENLW